MRMPTIPAERCTAKAKGTGQRCKRLVLGGGVCRMHGGATKAATARRLERIALAEQLASSPRRHPGAVLLDAVHTADVLAKQAKAELADHGVTPRTLRALTDATIRAAALARSALSAEAEDRTARFTEQQVRSIDTALARFLDKLGLTDDQAARAALAEALDGAAGEDQLLRSAAERRRTPDELGAYVASVIRALLTSLGLDRDADAWVNAQVAAMLRAVGRGQQPVAAPPPRSWWHMMAQRAARELGHPDPTSPPTLEILPALPRQALNNGLTL
jgi:hypothetical protein